MTQHKSPSVDLWKLCYRAMLDFGFLPEFAPECKAQIEKIESGSASTTEPPAQDLRNILWSSIDNDDSRDLDQIEFVERTADGGYRLLIGIADVDALLPYGTPLDAHAAHNCYTLYTGVRLFPMIPEELCTNLTSLLPDQDRLAMIVDITINQNGATTSATIFQARVRNRAKLDYEKVAKWLDGNAPLSALQRIPGLEKQLRLQAELGDLLMNFYRDSGSLSVQTLEARPITRDGKVVDMELTENNRAREIVKAFMVTANSALAQLLREEDYAMIQRVVRKPARWDRIVRLAADLDYELPTEPDSVALSKFVAEQQQKDPAGFAELSTSVVKLLGPGQYVVLDELDLPEGHFGLAVHDYTHATAPNRRFADLVTQRIAKAVVAKRQSPYTKEELELIVTQCEDRQSAARKLERRTRKAAAAVLLSTRIGETFDALVTGASRKGVYVRLLRPAAEGRLVKREAGLDVGDRVKVRLMSTDPERGFIDFEVLSETT